MSVQNIGQVDSLGQREIIELRNEWFYALTTPNKQEKLFELETLLKALDRFFNLQNQPISVKEAVIKRDFKNELAIIRHTVTRVVKLAQTLLSDEDTRALHFRNYVESRLLSDYQRAKRIERALLQRTPQESLYVLCHSFINFQEILHAVTNNAGPDTNSYFLFYHLEQLISREIAGNRFFNPFKAAGFAPHYDVIKSPRFSKVARSIEPPPLRKHISIIFLLIFKLLRYLSFIEPDKRDHQQLKNALIVFALVHSEAMLLVDLLERDMIKVAQDQVKDPELRRLLLDNMDALSYQLSMELKKIFSFELRDASQMKDMNQLRVGIARSRGILSTIFKQGLVHLAQIFDPDLEGKDVFPDFISRMEESLKLRKDIWLFHKVIENMERVIDESGPDEATIPVIEGIKTLRNFIFYYQNISFQFVRCYDREEFQNFFNLVDGLTPGSLSDSDKLDSFKLNLHTFKMFLETTLANINNRAELRDVPFGHEEGERLLAQFLS